MLKTSYHTNNPKQWSCTVSSSLMGLPLQLVDDIGEENFVSWMWQEKKYISSMGNGSKQCQKKTKHSSWRC